MKLIVLNGPSGVGKSTLALRLHSALPLSVLVEIDAWRRFISEYRTHKKESLELSYQFSLAAIEACLKAGKSVILDKVVFDDDEFLNSLHALAGTYSAEIYEFLLIAKKETLLARAESRGFEPNSLLTREGVLELGEQAQEFMHKRPQAVRIDTEELPPDTVYDMVSKIVFTQ